MDKRKEGSKYEDAAAEYLENAGYKILERNFYTHFGEIDIIAWKDGMIVFVEVKYRKSLKRGHPLEAVTKTKQQRIFKSAVYYLYKEGKENAACRFDVIGILDGSVTHIENAFEVNYVVCKIRKRINDLSGRRQDSFHPVSYIERFWFCKGRFFDKARWCK